jgi:mRNA-degrading endonuclease toxin of MazEF toxin-antitoxin module
VPAAPVELRRGRIFYGLFPFASRFPLTFGEGDAWVEAPDIETYARARRGEPTRIVAEARLRPILLLHDGTRGEHEDVVCLRINAVKRRHRRDRATWDRIERNEHLLFFHLPARPERYGLPAESIIALASIGTVHKSAILGPRHVGELTARELQVVSERLWRLLSLDLAPQIAASARELLRRAGIEPGG